MKNLYILVSDCADGSYYPRFVMDDAVLAKLQEAADLEYMDYQNGYGVDGDGFHYTTLTIPDECTPESLGLSGVISMEEALEFFEVKEDE